MQKILVIRFSSIGDIVLTATALNLLEQALPDARIHFLTKKPFVSLIENHPAVSQIHTLTKDNFPDLLRELQSENFDYILDLHNNFRSWRTVFTLRKPFATFPKPKAKLFLKLSLGIKKAEIPHVCDRYYQTAVKCVRYFHPEWNPGSFSPSLSFHFPKALLVPSVVNEIPLRDAYSIVLGATVPTKKWPSAYFVSLINEIGLPVILLGGESEKTEAEAISEKLNVPFYNSTGKHSLSESAGIMAQTRFVITHDTGFMHIASALQMKILSIWGSTAPELGFGPFQNLHHLTLEAGEVPCHPCSGIGKKECPKVHFDCMNRLTPERVMKLLKAGHIL
ncbi:MAG: glycosyltransferase family 9 protein [Bacteroidia bacterium]|nr:glycosyltransferase family 9 protein [Bacteroidia bacterium]